MVEGGTRDEGRGTRGRRETETETEGRGTRDEGKTRDRDRDRGTWDEGKTRDRDRGTRKKRCEVARLACRSFSVGRDRRKTRDRGTRSEGRGTRDEDSYRNSLFTIHYSLFAIRYSLFASTFAKATAGRVHYSLFTNSANASIIQALLQRMKEMRLVWWGY